MIARVEDLPAPQVERYRTWWHEVGRQGNASALYPISPVYAAYFTPEQLADYAEFGVIVFKGSAGAPCVLQLGVHPLPWGEGGMHCMRVNLGLVGSFVAYKLLWQADEVAARSIAGRDGARLPA